MFGRFLVVCPLQFYMGPIKTFDFLFFPSFPCFFSSPILHGSDGAAARARPRLGQRLLVQVGALHTAGQVGLHLQQVV